jgi:hypothetical protein
VKKDRLKERPFWTDEPLLDEKELYTDLAVKRGSILFFGRYSLNEIIAVMAKKGLLKEARQRFLWPLQFDLDSSDFPSQRLQIFFRDKSPDNSIVDLKIREMDFLPSEFPAGLVPFPKQKALAMEWLTIQNPLAKFTPEQVPLPGQVRPGLGMRKKIKELFVYLGRLMHKDCLLAFPAYFHNAVLFSRYFRFWNPVKEAEFLAIRRGFLHMNFKQLAWVIHLNCLKRADGTVYEWKAEEQLYPMTRSLKDYFDSRPYKEMVRDLARSLEFHVDWDEYDKKAAEYPFLCGRGRDLL